MSVQCLEPGIQGMLVNEYGRKKRRKEEKVGGRRDQQSER